MLFKKYRYDENGKCVRCGAESYHICRDRGEFYEVTESDGLVRIVKKRDDKIFKNSLQMGRGQQGYSLSAV